MLHLTPHRPMPIKIPNPVSSVIDFGRDLLDKLFPDPVKRKEAELAMAELIQSGKIKELTVRMSAILAEAQSSDPWTSRWRPMFAYVFYVILLTMTVVAPIIGIFSPAAMEAFFANVATGFEAMPEELWWTFGVGYVGYGGMRSYDKKQKLNGST